MAFRQMSGLFPMPVFFETGIPQSWQVGYLIFISEPRKFANSRFSGHFWPHISAPAQPTPLVLHGRTSQPFMSSTRRTVTGFRQMTPRHGRSSETELLTQRFQSRPTRAASTPMSVVTTAPQPSAAIAASPLAFLVSELSFTGMLRAPA